MQISPQIEKVQQEIIELEKRLGPVHARQRLGIEREHEGQVFGGGINFFHIENWYSIHSFLKAVLKGSGLFWRGLKNSYDIEVRHNSIAHRLVPEPFQGFTILQLSDLHLDLCEPAMQRLTEILPELAYDICVLTGDYRGKTYGSFEPAMALLNRLRAEIRDPIYAVLGNHDTIRMVPAMEKMGIQTLLNESVAIGRGGKHVYLAGIDDAHFYGVDNIEKAASAIPFGAFSILLSHTPEVYRQAAYAGFSLMLSGHTHGGQICLPSGIPIHLNAVVPRRMGAGVWRHHSMAGYTSVGAGSCIVPVRFNCRPEVTLHQLVSL